jgi:dephospho-CoA kinase
MPLILITGLPGSGKSTVNTELKARGYESYDADEDHLAHWYDNETGLVVMQEDEKRTAEFVATHSRDIARETVEGLAAQTIDNPVFLCGDPENEDELRDLFSKIFALVIDEDLRQHRLATRGNNTWGKLPHEIAYDLTFQQKAPETYAKFGYITLDATQPVANNVDYILKRICE